MNVVLVVAGALMIVAVLQDVFVTVLVPASRHGVIRKPLTRSTWCVFRLLAQLTSGTRRHNLLSYAAPVQVTITMSAWALLLLIGFAMIYKPALGTSIQASSGATDTGWWTALYYSGFSLTTLGVGDVVPQNGPYRFLTVSESALGFVIITMVITYFLSVYSSLTKRNSFAQALHNRSGNTGDAAELLARLAVGPELPDARGHFLAKADALRETYQTHRFHPALRYFHYREPFYALPRVLLISLDAATLVSTALEPDRYVGVVRSPGRLELLEAAMVLMRELVPEGRPVEPSTADVDLWRVRYSAALSRLSAAGLHVCTDRDAGAEQYVALRRRWDGHLRVLSAELLYEWEEIDVTVLRVRSGVDRRRAGR
jgi:hypothetical protein